MNKQRRGELAKVLDLLQGVRDMLESAKDDEEMTFDNFPESLQESVRGEAMQEAIDNMESALDSIDEAIGSVEEAMA